MAAPTTTRGIKFFWRLCAGFVGLVLATSLAIGTLVDSRVREDLLASVEQNLTAEAAFLAELAEPVLAGRSPVARLQRQADTLAERAESRLTVMDADGVVIVDTGQAPAGMDNHLARPEVQQALREGLGRSERFSGTLGVDLLYVAVPVRSEGQLRGVCRASLSLHELGERTARVRNIVLAGAAGAALIGMVLALAYARRVTAPLAQLTAAVEATTRGGFARVDVPLEDDEIGRLGTAFNAMAAELRDRMEIITANHNKVLAILSSMDEGVVAVDREDRVVHMNAVAGALLSLVPEECAGRPIWELTRDIDVSGALAHARETGESTRVEVRVRPGIAAEERVLRLNASPLTDASGDRSGAVVVVDDLTELRRLEEVRRDFVANVSHELKTPLAAIRAMVEMLVDAPDLDPQKQLDFHGRVLRQTDRLSTLVQDLLTLARLEEPRSPRETAQIDLCDSVTRARARFQPQAEKQSIDLIVTQPGEPLRVSADEEDLRQILDNLLDNAIKYTPAGGTVEVRLGTTEGQALIEVIDTGAGIEPRHQDRIFERFYRVDKARSRELGGTGLGLSIVKHLTLSLRGQVGIESAPGRGSRFWVRLPLATTGEV